MELVAAAAACAGNREAGITYLTLLPIAGGVVIASGGEPLFHLLGFVACLLATSGRALKSVVQVGRKRRARPGQQLGAVQQGQWQRQAQLVLAPAVLLLVKNGQCSAAVRSSPCEASSKATCEVLEAREALAFRFSCASLHALTCACPAALHACARRCCCRTLVKSWTP